MRIAHSISFVVVSLAMMWLTLASGVTHASDSDPLNAEEQAFLTRAMSDNAVQLAMAQLALAKSKNPQIIELANAIINERIALDQELVVLASGSIDRTALQQHAVDDHRMAALQSLNGDAFDKTFTGLLVRDHCEIISAYEAMKVTSTHDTLKAIAHSAVPALQGNLTIALAVLRSGSWKPVSHQEALTSADEHSSKMPAYWEPISIVTAPW